MFVCWTNIVFPPLNVALLESIWVIYQHIPVVTSVFICGRFSVANKKLESIQKCVLLIVSSLNVWASLCTEMHGLKCCFHVYLLREESFSELTLNLSLRSGFWDVWRPRCNLCDVQHPYADTELKKKISTSIDKCHFNLLIYLCWKNTPGSHYYSKQSISTCLKTCSEGIWNKFPKCDTLICMLRVQPEMVVSPGWNGKYKWPCL